MRFLRVWGQAISGAWNEILTHGTYPSGDGLHVYLQPRAMVSGAYDITTSWAWAETIGDSNIITETQVLNPTSVAISFSLALLDNEGGTPGSDDYFLAKDVSVGTNGVWQFQGKMPYLERFVFAKASANGLVMQVAGEEAHD